MSARTDRDRLKREIMRDVRQLLAGVGSGGGGAVTDLTVGTVANGQVVGNVAGVLAGVSPSAPGLHATAHQNGGADEISVAGLSGVLADPQPPIIGGGAAQAVAGNDARLADARTPTAHHVSHENGGTDEISVAGLSGVLADPQPPIIGAGAAQAVAGNDARLTDARTPLAHTHPAADIASGTIAIARIPTGTTGATVPFGNDARFSDARTPLAHSHVLADLPAALIIDTELATELADYVDFTTFDAHAAQHQNGGSDELNVAGLSGVLADPQPPIIGAGAAQAVAGNDARLTDARNPLAHKTSHQSGGADQINVAGLSGVLADPQPPIIGATATTAVAGNDARLTNARTPTAHAASHASAGSDPLTLAQSQVANLTSDLAGKAASVHTHAESDITNLVTDLAAKAPIGVLKSVQVFATGGAFTWNRPAGVVSVRFRLIGGGGAGGSSAGAASSAGFAGGGGSGAYAEKIVNNPAASYNGSVGVAGVAGAAGNTVGGNGGNTTLTIGATTVTASGGAGGSGSGAAAATALAVLGGAGGVVATNGDANTPGTPGDPGLRSSGTIGMSGNGGRGPLGGGGLGRIAAGAGAAGGNYGAGGSGAASIAAGNFAGGAGGVGCVIAEEFG